MKYVLIFYLIELLTSVSTTIEAPHDIKKIKNLLKKNDIITLEKYFNTNPKLVNNIKDYLQKKQQQNIHLQTTLNTVITLQESKKIKAKL